MIPLFYIHYIFGHAFHFIIKRIFHLILYGYSEFPALSLKPIIFKYLYDISNVYTYLFYKLSDTAIDGMDTLFIRITDISGCD